MASQHLLPDTTVTVSCVIVADEGYPLLPYLMRSFPKRQLDQSKRIFNYRLSPARRNVKCGFGILCSKWRVLLKVIETNITATTLVVKNVFVLHYIFEKEVPDSPHYSIHKEPIPMRLRPRPCQYRFQSSAIELRGIFLTYFNGTGCARWQKDYALPENMLAKRSG